jgi:hypothetical protein
MTNPEDFLPTYDPTFKSDNSTFTARMVASNIWQFYDEEGDPLINITFADSTPEPSEIQALLPIAQQFFEAGEESGRLQGKWHLAYQIKGLLGIPYDIQERLTDLENKVD